MLSSVLNPTGMLKVGGVVLIVLGLLGFTGVTNSFQPFFLTAGENIAHVALGVVGLAVAFGIKDTRAHRALVGVLAITGFAFGLWGFLLPTGRLPEALTMGNFYGLANLENPLDNALHIVVGIWATVAYFMGRQPAMAEARA
jgi:hypothetical protein